MKIIKEAIAGTLESSDVLVRVAPADHDELTIEIKSSVEKQFGTQIKESVMHIIHQLEITYGKIIIDDKGALDCVLQARVQAALLRACDDSSIPWSKLV